MSLVMEARPHGSRSGTTVADRWLPVAAAAVAIGVRLAAVVVILGSLAWERRPMPWKPAGILAAWIVPLAVFLLARYGSPVPHSVVAKSTPIY